MRVHSVDAMTDVDPTAWDGLAAPASFYATHGWLASQEDPDTGPRHFVVETDTGRPLGAVATYLCRRVANPNYRVGALFPDLTDLTTPQGRPVLLAGGTQGYHHPLLIARDLTTADRRRVLDLLVAAVREYARESADGVTWWLYLPDGDARELARCLGTAPRLVRGDCAIHLPGDSFHDFLAAFPSRRRRILRREDEAFEAAGHELRRLPLSACWREAGALLARTQRRYGHRVDDEEMATLLRRQSEATGDSGTVHGCFADGRMAGFCLTYAVGDTLYARASGFDYGRLGGAKEHFRVCYYDPVRLAYATGRHTYHLGVGSYRTKTLRGAAVTPLWALCDGDPRWTREAAADHNATTARTLLADIPPHALRDPSSWPLVGLRGTTSAVFYVS
ncbi:GNAT family N-acetyltransferase [Streptomyces sp. PTM05]|uniref:GNAT family N-acetyltransferase n=1 Tax=Streptantibioticus parmotrematis TaxID=2873249 RepID=A0ABS7QS50_9ACTN|nr:GNAT family N-acetyltransferase [Streptantibioticus parmotrematis]MBY8886017.1 GNAT family N-acetyltransferase [Streptantibioticus parmotrematis]